MTTIGKRVKFTKGETTIQGIVKDEVTFLEEHDNRDYLDLIQFIHWDNGRRSIRLCYYVREQGLEDEGWKFANRPLNINPKELREFLIKASEKDWF